MVVETAVMSGDKIRVLIVDDSLVFRRFLEDMLSDCADIVVVGEARNGIDGLDMMLRTRPDVILLDLEMPLMDGMTALQHLMIHQPTPTIMFSSLTEKGTPRSFDTLKNGAVDFFCKDFIFQKNNLQNHKKLVIDRVRRAAQIRLAAREPAFPVELQPTPAKAAGQRFLFCEECGGRVVVTVSAQSQSITCSHCGDTIDPLLHANSQYRRITCITVLGGGEGSFFNLLEIIPQLEPEMGGALVAVIHQPGDHVSSFAEYLDAISAIKVVRAREGFTLEGGNCYIVSGQEYMSVKPYSTQLTLQKLNSRDVQGGPFDTLLASVSSVYKKRAAAIILSGNECDGDIGVSMLIKNKGSEFVLDGAECYCTKMSEHIKKQCDLTTTLTTGQIIRDIRELHYQAKYGS